MLKDVDKALKEYLSRRPQDAEYLTGYIERHPERKDELVAALLEREATAEEQRKNPPPQKALTPDGESKLEENMRFWDEMMFG